MKAIFLFLLFISEIGIVWPQCAGSVTLRIHLHIFSGRPDPEWVIDDTNVNFQAIVDQTKAHIPTTPPSHLGYRGFTVTIRRGGCLGSKMVDIGKGTNIPLERLLLDTVAGLIPEGYDGPFSANLVQGIRQTLSS